MTINRFQGDYNFLSNFYASPVFFHGIIFQTSEGAYQAQKAANFSDREAFAGLSGGPAKRKGRTIALRADWETVKIEAMRGVLRAKFTQSPELLAKLLATGEEPLEEGNTWGDTFWGTVNGQGQNWLGRLLMELRVSLRWETSTGL